jgi:hypothetical protein
MLVVSELRKWMIVRGTLNLIEDMYVTIELVINVVPYARLRSTPQFLMKSLC